MSDPTVEEVREALDITERSQFELVDVGEFTKALDVVVAAARLWVDAAEPDTAAAIDARMNYISTNREDVSQIIAAAFGDNNLIRRTK